MQSYHFDPIESQNYPSFFQKYPLIFPKQPRYEVVSAIPYRTISALFAGAKKTLFQEG